MRAATATLVTAAALASMSAAATLTEAQADAYAALALAGITREFPNKPMHVHAGPGSARRPRALHPVFYGCYDWHSAVHGHWMLVRLLRGGHLGEDKAAAVRAALDAQLTADGLAAEAAYFDAPENRSYERMYGWAWLLRLAAELRAWDDPDARRWAADLGPLEAKIVALAKAYLPKLDWPVRCGFHPESSFALGQFHDYAHEVGDAEFVKLIEAKARAFYAADRDYPVRYEPSGNDFFSAGLNEADLMRRVLPADAFSAWLDAFFPGLAGREMGNLLTPAEVSDPSDGHLVHLAGLNLNRAWTMRGIASALPDEDPRQAVLEGAAAEHTEAGLAYVDSGHYEGDHWLASFAVYLLDGVGR